MSMFFVHKQIDVGDFLLAAKSIAASLEKIANPPYWVGERDDLLKQLLSLREIGSDLIKTMDLHGYDSVGPEANEAWRKLREAVR